MNRSPSKSQALLEVICVFLLTILAVKVLKITFLGKWQSAHLPKPFLNHTLMMGIPLLLLVLTRRSFAVYGISFKNMKYHLKIVLICLLPVMIASSVFAFVDWEKWSGALILAPVYLALLFVLAGFLRKQPSLGNGVTLGVFLLLAATPLSAGTITGKNILGFLYHFIFVGFGEEILFRGYFQSRLNIAFGRPFRFFGVKWGWGIIIVSLIFGFAHVLNPFNPFLGQFGLVWPYGFWTFFTGLLFGYLREKTGSVVAPALIHGIPQAFASLFFGL
jgi:membrane protease YdiL (CAAX protease family)